MLAEGYGAAGQPDEELRQLDEATRHMDATQERRAKGRFIVIQLIQVICVNGRS